MAWNFWRTLTTSTHTGNLQAFGLFGLFCVN
jgi:hypothetical protein